MTLLELKQFFQNRPQLTAHGTAMECVPKMSPRLLDYILKSERSLTEKSIQKLLPVMIKYGYNEAL